MKFVAQHLLERTGHWRRPARLATKTAIDGALVAAAFLAASLMRFGMQMTPRAFHTVALFLPFVVALKLLTFNYFSLTRDLWRYVGLSDLVRLVRAVLIASLFVATFSYLAPFENLPRSIFLMDAALTLLLVGGARFLVRWLREMPAGSSLRRPFGRLRLADGGLLERALVVGAGHAGEMMVREMRRRIQWLRMDPVGLVDDDPDKKGMFIHGLSVLGGREDIPQICRDYKVDRIVLCLPSVKGANIRDIHRYCRSTGARIGIVPRLEEIVSGQAKVSDVRSLRVEDLLGREKIEFNMDQVSSYIRGRRVLVTGAGGSIGSELCRQIVTFKPSEMVLLGRGENSIFSISSELGRKAPEVLRHEVIGDVINRRKIEGVFRQYRSEIVFHAGADKHVPLMEKNPDEAVLNNIVGTMNILDVADKFGAARLVAISTDKAVRPSSIMGCCKRVAEMLVRSRPLERTTAVAVRFGNVLGSRGSVVPFFREQIRNGGPVTVTHPEMERFFMTIPEAAALVIQAGALGTGGEIFLLDMGDPVRIVDLAREMIRLAGLEPEEDVPIHFSGLRPGEKLKEALTGPGERVGETEHAKIKVVHCPPVDPGWLQAQVDLLKEAAVRMDEDRIIDLLSQIVEDYSPLRDRKTADAGAAGGVNVAGSALPSAH
ncbi:MAG: polysaccharide biosynthesis protein [Acidobacteriota bacterium]